MLQRLQFHHPLLYLLSLLRLYPTEADDGFSGNQIDERKLQRIYRCFYQITFGSPSLL